ncbi:hypothetical protein BCR44DRAFT_1260014 [Catenaria anguillulae PL171]|uniref:Uncharacterized protein n=1 Tax=Catenaria anguillulae PL171 TaxID=765915 RepID=A0A1Y2HBK2_9FUNG|nr:hypothetical protein BCR44DRAFT_1260014 [Catenaria anguillulae PL171]
MNNPHGPPSSTAAGHGLGLSHHNHPANNIAFKSPLLAHLAASSARLPTTADQHHHAGPAPSSRNPGHAPPPHLGGYTARHNPPSSHHHQSGFTADPQDMSIMSTADMSFQSRANTSDFMSPLLPRQLQQPASSSSPAGAGHASALTDLVHGAGTLTLTDRSPTLAHAPLQPMHAPGSSGNREYEQLMRIYGWQESPTMASADPFYANPLLAASTVNLSAAQKFNAAYDAPPVPPTPSMAAGVLDAAGGASAKGQQDQSGSWSGFLGKLRGKSSKPGTPPAGTPTDPQSRSRQGSASGPSGAGGALAALSSLAKRTVGQEVIPRFGRRGSDSSLNPPPSSRFAPLSSTSPMGQASASARAGGARRDFPDRDDASFTSFTLHGDEPLRSPAVAHMRRLSGSGYGDDTVDEDGNLGNTTEYFVHADTTEVVLTPGGAGGYMGRPEHRRANSDQTVHSVMAMSMSVGQGATSNHPGSTVPGGHATAAAVAALRPATAPTHAQQQQQPAGPGAAPAPVPIAMHRSDSGFHMLDSGIHRDSVAAPSTVSGSSSASLSSSTSSAKDARRQGFATYRLTQAPPLSYDNMDDEAAEDDAEVVIDDDEQPLGATMSHPHQQHQHTGGGRPIALTVPPRSTSIKPTNPGSSQSQQPPPLSSTPSSMSLTSPSSLDLASGGHGLMSHENSTVLNVSAAPASATNAGEFGLPPSGHPFWTNPRIFDPPTPVKGLQARRFRRGRFRPWCGR